MCNVVLVRHSGILPASWSLLARPPDRPAALPFSSGERPRRRAAAVVQPPVFTFEPSCGVLLPDQWAVINVIFAPGKSVSESGGWEEAVIL